MFLHNFLISYSWPVPATADIPKIFKSVYIFFQILENANEDWRFQHNVINGRVVN